MRDEKICPTCGGPLVWKGNVLDGALDCAHCAQVEFVEEPTQLAMLKDEEQPTQDEVDANIKSLNRAAGIKPEYAEWDDLCLHDIYMDKASGKDFTPEPATIPPGLFATGRRTGRTTRMVVRALQTAATGKKVIILAHNQLMVRRIEQMIGQRGHAKGPHGLFFVPHLDNGPVGSVRVLSVIVTPRGIGRDVEVHADHSIFDEFSPFTAEHMGAWRARHEINS